MGRTQGDRKLSRPATKHNKALRIIDEENISISNMRFYIVDVGRISATLLLTISCSGNHPK